ncbi:hypothetical protein [Nocardia sp. NPDC019395]|uniref:hypothetical protein n=1 Tax=Nocardia sp. NPDC019395 TaxID=3154686 RepID=UPI0033CFBDF8
MHGTADDSLSEFAEIVADDHSAGGRPEGTRDAIDGSGRIAVQAGDQHDRSAAVAVIVSF